MPVCLEREAPQKGAHIEIRPDASEPATCHGGIVGRQFCTHSSRTLFLAQLEGFQTKESNHFDGSLEQTTGVLVCWQLALTFHMFRAALDFLSTRLSDVGLCLNMGTFRLRGVPFKGNPSQAECPRHALAKGRKDSPTSTWDWPTGPVGAQARETTEGGHSSFLLGQEHGWVLSCTVLSTWFAC